MSSEFRGEAIYAVWHTRREDVLHTTAKADPNLLEYEFREPIVRCKDCEHMREFHPLNPITGVPCGITITKCSYWWNPDELPEVDPNDFCSNGERRADA